MTPSPLPIVPWQITGNHWLALPCIHPADGSIRAVGIMHRGARGAIELAGDPEFLEGKGSPLAIPSFEIDGKVRRLSEVGMAWERAFGWVPTFTATLDSIVIRGTIFAPFGRDGDVPAAVYALSVENRSDADRTIIVRLNGTFGHQQLRIRTPRELPGERTVTYRDHGAVILEERRLLLGRILRLPVHVGDHVQRLLVAGLAAARAEERERAQRSMGEGPAHHE